MRRSTKAFRLGLWLATTSLSWAASLPALAQPAPPPGAAEDAGDAASDPPAVAGRLARIDGAVSYHAGGETQWNAAALNYPVTSGGSFWTEPQASAELQIADDRVVMDGSTELDVGQLDQSQFSVTTPQGAVFLQLGSLPDGQAVSVTTPRAVVQITQPGRYEIVAGDTADPTTVTVVEGAAHIEGNGVALDVGARQTASVEGSDRFQGDVGPLREDRFLDSQLQVATPRLAEAAPRQVRYMTGSSDLATYGDWDQTPEYGQVWYPRDVAADWAPYRDGHWAYVAPWGWTWVDNAPWGFAPFHYGRWVQVRDRWGWVAVAPGAPVAEYPVYAPALVSFVDVGGAVLAGAAIGFAAGVLAAGAPAWIPLGPGEAYYPWYRVRPDYFARVNVLYGVPRPIILRGPTYITNIHQTNIFVNRRFATVMPGDALARGQAVRGYGRPLPEAALANARPVVGRLPVRPTAYTPHLTPAVARRYAIAPAPAAARPAAAGPRIAAPGERRGLPVLSSAAMPQNLRPAARVGGPVTPQAPRLPAAAGAPQPGRERAMPGLRPPNAGRPAVGAAMQPPGRPTAPQPAAAERPNASQAPRALPGLRSPGAIPQSVQRPARAERPVTAPTTLARPEALPRPTPSAAPVPRPSASAARPQTPARPIAAEPPIRHEAPPTRLAQPRAPAPPVLARPQPMPRPAAPRMESPRMPPPMHMQAPPRMPAPPAPRVAAPPPAAPHPPAPGPHQNRPGG